MNTQNWFYTRETMRGIRIAQLVKTPSFLMIGWDNWIKKRGNYLSYIEGGWKTFAVLHKILLYMFIYYKIFFEYTYAKQMWIMVSRFSTIVRRIFCTIHLIKNVSSSMPHKKLRDSEIHSGNFTHLFMNRFW